jgi:hypothetical protein
MKPVRKLFFATLINITSLCLGAAPQPQQKRYAALAQDIRHYLTNPATIENFKNFLLSTLAAQPLKAPARDQAKELLSAFDTALSIDWPKINQLRAEQPQHPDLKRADEAGFDLWSKLAEFMAALNEGMDATQSEKFWRTIAQSLVTAGSNAIQQSRPQTGGGFMYVPERVYPTENSQLLQRK